ncbi:MAG TPA: CotH kinase family protein, partial [Anaerohalosphaeraceae bacterium]|nr:CotH kinase family protein [Anaerohalosphaeraceae bacterium]
MKNKALILCFLLTLQMLFSSALLGCFVVGDINGDCQVGVGDLVLLASQWMEPSSCGSETGLVLHWKFDETSGLYAADASGWGKTGTVYGASWNPTGGTIGGALQFNQADNYVYAYVEGHPSTIFRGIAGTNPRSCTAWIKTDQPSGGIMAWGSELNSQLWLVWVDEKGLLRVDVGGGYIIGTTLLTDDLWHHIAVTSNGTSTDNIALYVDGRLETLGGVVSQSVNTASTLPMTLGKYYSTFKVFNGLIDDVRVYNRVLSLQDVWNLAITGTTRSSCADMNMDMMMNLGDVARMAQSWMLHAPPVVISEFLADNESKSPLGQGDILDGNGESSDWIEIHNHSGMVMDINGWYLTDDSNLKTKWRFPVEMSQLVLQPGSYLIVFASGKTQAENPGNYPYVDLAGYLHTNFQLSKDGEYLGLIDSDGITPVHEYNHIDLGGEKQGYPAQDLDVSYGCYYDEVRYFSVPTPGADNLKGSFEQVTQKPDVNMKGGCHINAFSLTMSCTTPGAFIRYTTDGSAPTLINGLDYTAPVAVSRTTRIIARAFKPGFQPSDARIETYIFVDPAVSPSNTNLPIVVVDTLGAPIVSDVANKPWTRCISVIVDVDAATGRADITGPQHFNGLGQIRYRGESTYGNRHFRVEMLDEYDVDKKVSLLDMPAESDWVLSSDQLDYTSMKKGLAYKWFQDMGHYAPRQQYVELYLNTDGGAISTADYKGLFILRETIKRGDDRVDIARLDASHNLEPKVSGGYIIKSDKPDTGDIILNQQSLWEPAYYNIGSGAGTGILADPDSSVITGSQINWVIRYLNEVHSVFWQNTASIYYPGSQAKYTDYVDVISWIDHGLLEQVCLDSDAFWGSYYTYKDRNGKVFSGPPWDYDRGFHNNANTYDRPYNTWRTAGEIFGKWHTKLQEHPEYRITLADRWFEHREKVLDTALTMAYIDQTKALLTESIVQRPKKSYPNSFDVEINLFKTWITNRLNYLDGYIASTFAKTPPIFNPVGGYVNPGASLDISKPSGAAGDIYYTTNGEDPRLPGGSVNSNASIISETGRVVLEYEDFETGMGNWVNLSSGDTHDWIRDSGGTPSGSTGPAAGALSSTWYMYLEASDASVSGNTAILEGPGMDGTARELTFYYHMYGSNMGTLNVDVYSSGSWTNGIWSRTGQQHTSNGAAYTKATVNLNAYTGTIKIRFRAVAAGGSKGDMAIDKIEITKDAEGESLILNKSSSVKARIKDGSSWSAMNTEVYGVGPVLQNLRISELMYHPSDPTPAEMTAAGNPNLTDEDFEFIELTNVGSTAINLNLVRFTDGIDFTFGDYTLAAGGYAVLVKNQAAFAARYGTAGINIVPGSYLGSLDNNGEEIVLRDALGAEIH